MSNDAVAKGVGPANELRIVTLGKTATLYVNGKQIATLKGFPPAGGSRIGLHAESGQTVYTWKFSDLEVRRPAPVAASASASPADPAVLFSDDFSTLDPAWGPADGQQSVAGGNLVFQPNAGNSYTSLYQGTLFRDADIRVKISEASGDTDEPAGIVFWATDYSNLYTAQVRGDGSVGISQLKQGSWRLRSLTPCKTPWPKALARSTSCASLPRASGSRFTSTVSRSPPLTANRRAAAARSAFAPSPAPSRSTPGNSPT